MAAQAQQGGGTMFLGEYEYSGAAESVALPRGKYRLECWGAQGGSYNTDYGGYGGYSSGILTLTEDTTLYIYVGGQPSTVSTFRAVVPGGFNGGGNGQNRHYAGTFTYGQGGGGASDIRIGEDSLYARVIVAGGGGGSASNGDERSSKCGGGRYGGPGAIDETAAYNAGPLEPTGSRDGDRYYKAGTFGQGAGAGTDKTNYQHGSGGGGGGWYGGYACNTAQDSDPSLKGYNGGGSGYVYTEDTANDFPSGCLLNSSHYLTSASTHKGSDGGDYAREGHGLVKITQIA